MTSPLDDAKQQKKREDDANYQEEGPGGTMESPDVDDNVTERMDALGSDAAKAAEEGTYDFTEELDEGKKPDEEPDIIDPLAEEEKKKGK